MPLESAFANLHNAVIARIAELVPEIQFIEQDFGQLDFYIIRPAVSWPCALIDVADDFDFSDTGNKPEQIAEGFVRIRLGLIKYTDTSNLMPSHHREKGLQYYELEAKLISALHRFRPDGFGYLLRRKAVTEKREDDIRVRDIRFAMSFTDEVAPPLVSVPVPAPTLRVRAKES